MPLLHSGTQRNHKDFSSDVPSNAVWCGIRRKTFLKIMVVAVFGPPLILGILDVYSLFLGVVSLRSLEKQGKQEQGGAPSTRDERIGCVVFAWHIFLAL